jgi:hypothetical protein
VKHNPKGDDDDDDDKGTMKIVLSGSASDTLDWQNHIRSKKRREELAKVTRNHLSNWSWQSVKLYRLPWGQTCLKTKPLQCPQDDSFTRFDFVRSGTPGLLICAG